MTKNEFKAWFDGFCEGMDGIPNEKQWERIKSRVSEINDIAIPYPVYVDRYVAPYRRWYEGPIWNSPYTAALSASSHVDAVSSVSMNGGSLIKGATHAETFDSLPSMKAAGQAEYRSMLAS